MKDINNEKELEILKLKKMLEESNIPFEFNDDLFEGDHKPSYIIVINDKNGDRLCDAIYHFGSYGYEKGLLEIMDGLTKKEREESRVLGYLTAEMVFKRFKYCYENQTDEYIYENAIGNLTYPEFVKYCSKFGKEKYEYEVIHNLILFYETASDKTMFEIIESMQLGKFKEFINYLLEEVVE